MKVWWAPYKLKPLRRHQALHLSSEGALLRFENQKGVRYSLYHPIQNLGDLPLKEFLNNFSLESRLAGSILNVATDFSVQGQVPCYASLASINDLNTPKLQGYKVVKLKVPSFSYIKTHAPLFLETDFKFIFDLNGRGFFENSFDADFVFYIEDPFKIDSKKPMPFDVASDLITYQFSKYQVHKPTGFNHSFNLNLAQRLVVTSYLDHPLGQYVAAEQALKFKTQELCGLNTHTYFEANKYSEHLKQVPFFDLSVANAWKVILEQELWRPLC